MAVLPLATLYRPAAGSVTLSTVGATPMVTMSVSIMAPPEPVLPPSLVVMVSTASTGACASAPCNDALTAVKVPLMVTRDVPEFVTIAPPEAVTATVPPLLMPSVTVMVPEAASTSVTDSALPLPVLKTFPELRPTNVLLLPVVFALPA